MEPASKLDGSAIPDQARVLVAEFGTGKSSAGESLIEEPGRMREQNLFRELGNMTRQLRAPLNSFAFGSRMVLFDESDIPAAKARLNHVIDMTEGSANRTLTSMAGTLPIAEQLRKQAKTLHEDWARFCNNYMQVKELRDMSKAIDDLLGVAAGGGAVSDQDEVDDLLSSLGF
jgi:chemotaxis protein CheZ